MLLFLVLCLPAVLCKSTKSQETINHYDTKSFSDVDAYPYYDYSDYNSYDYYEYPTVDVSALISGNSTIVSTQQFNSAVGFIGDVTERLLAKARKVQNSSPIILSNAKRLCPEFTMDFEHYVSSYFMFKKEFTPRPLLNLIAKVSSEDCYQLTKLVAGFSDNTIRIPKSVDELDSITQQHIPSFRAKLSDCYEEFADKINFLFQNEDDYRPAVDYINQFATLLINTANASFINGYLPDKASIEQIIIYIIQLDGEAKDGVNVVFPEIINYFEALKSWGYFMTAARYLSYDLQFYNDLLEKNTIQMVDDLSSVGVNKSYREVISAIRAGQTVIM